MYSVTKYSVQLVPTGSTSPVLPSAKILQFQILPQLPPWLGLGTYETCETTDWKMGPNCELKLNCESGVMKVTMTADLGDWRKPPDPKSGESGNSVHQGPRRSS